MKTKEFPRYVKTKTNYDKNRFNLIPNIKHENKKQKMKCVRQNLNCILL